MNWRPLGKALVIVSSLTLGCTYVAYRQKQSTALETTGKEKTVLPSSKNPNRATVFPSSKNIDAVIFPGSAGSPRTNSDFIDPTILSETPSDDAKKAEEEKRELLGEIKHLWDDDSANPPHGEEGRGGKKRTLLPSSKIGAILSPDDAPINRSDIDEQRKKQEPEEKK